MQWRRAHARGALLGRVAAAVAAALLGFLLYGGLELWDRAGDIPFALRWSPARAGLVVAIILIPAIPAIALGAWCLSDLGADLRGERLRHGCCWNCGYDVFDTVRRAGPTCPECGVVADPPPQVRRFPARGVSRLIGLVAAAVLVGTLLAAVHVWQDEARFRPRILANPPPRPHGHLRVPRSFPFGVWRMEAYWDDQGQIVYFEYGD